MEGSIQPQEAAAEATSSSVVIIPLWARIGEDYQATAQREKEALRALSLPTHSRLEKPGTRGLAGADLVEAGDCRLAETDAGNGNGFNVKILETEDDIKVEFCPEDSQKEAEAADDQTERRITRSVARAAGSQVSEVEENPRDRVPTKSRSHRVLCVTKTGRRRNRVLGETFETEIDIKVAVEQDQSQEETVAGRAVNDEAMLEPKGENELLERRVTRRTTRAKAAGTGSTASEIFRDPVITKPGQQRSFGEREKETLHALNVRTHSRLEEPIESSNAGAQTAVAGDCSLTETGAYGRSSFSAVKIDKTESDIKVEFSEEQLPENATESEAEELLEPESESDFAGRRVTRSSTSAKATGCQVPEDENNPCDRVQKNHKGQPAGFAKKSCGRKNFVLEKKLSAENANGENFMECEGPVRPTGTERESGNKKATEANSSLENSRKSPSKTPSAIKIGFRRKYMCLRCDFSANGRLRLAKHCRINHPGEKPYMCTLCNFVSSKSGDLMIHRHQEHAGKKPYNCEICEYVTISSSILARHLRAHTGEKSYKCELCDFACTRSYNLVIHRRSHTEEKPHKCELCDFGTFCLSKLKLHRRRTHLGPKPYKCDLCNFETKRSGGLQNHRLTHGGEKRYKCEICDYTAIRSDYLAKHRLGHDPENLPYKCDMCVRAFTTRPLLTEHRRRHTGEKPYKCDLCDYASVLASCVVSHRRIHTGEKPYKCSMCDFAATSLATLVSHRRTHTGEKPYQCDLCSFTTANSVRLNVHRRSHTGEKPYKCSSCNYAAASQDNLNKHRKRHTGEKPHKCTVCEYVTAERGNLVRHRRTHTGEKPYKCDLCEYVASTSDQVRYHHRLIHAKCKPYKCTLCDYAASTAELLKNHRRTHTGEKPYKCDLCDYAAAGPTGLLVHRRIHTGEKPYKCELCDFAATNNANLTKHLRKHTGEKRHKCSVCSFKTTELYLLTRHLRTHTGEKPFKCTVCDFATAHSSILVSHRLTQHKH